MICKEYSSYTHMISHSVIKLKDAAVIFFTETQQEELIPVLNKALYTRIEFWQVLVGSTETGRHLANVYSRLSDRSRTNVQLQWKGHSQKTSANLHPISARNHWLRALTGVFWRGAEQSDS